MSYMDYNEFQAIMLENSYQQSKAVEVYLNKASYYTRLIKRIVENTADKQPIVKVKMEKFIKMYNDKRIEAVWDAISVAELEKLQGWKFIEDGEMFILNLQIKYQGKLKKATDFEKKQVELATLYEQAYKKQLVKEN
ncbi:hypothetical protein [Ligilactobacillus salivarius]|uniref:hypothetical protein n=1 Tax=Ligilactobacillus salivarius TaxID=1624 RepID=UPI0013702C7D|nr:hypothetical protein [Ligilactobacillus salivarius]MBN2921684.1 hypothetical protein [Lactobacillus sp.]MYV13636.1 hypothetical protein [Ligilactobacillus salivarius]MYY55196.1 hypothetical protein [Ligilactobacillus salivarius]